MNTPHKLADLIKAWADGATIQVSTTGRPQWSDCGPPGGDHQPAWDVEDGIFYRVKPANIERYCPVYRRPDGSIVVGRAVTSSHESLGTNHADRQVSDEYVGTVHLTINPDTLELVSATKEKWHALL